MSLKPSLKISGNWSKYIASIRNAIPTASSSRSLSNEMVCFSMGTGLINAGLANQNKVSYKKVQFIIVKPPQGLYYHGLPKKGPWAVGVPYKVGWANIAGIIIEHYKVHKVAQIMHDIVG